MNDLLHAVILVKSNAILALSIIGILSITEPKFLLSKP